LAARESPICAIFADDTTLVAADAVELEELLRRLEDMSEEFGLHINRRKTKVMIVDRENNNHPTMKEIGSCEIVNNMVYLESLINNTGSYELEIRRRIQLGKAEVKELTKIWVDRDVRCETKVRLMNTLVFPVFLYAAETWTVHESDRRRIDAFEMYCWRRMLRIPWPAHHTNASILDEIKPEHRLYEVVNLRILSFLGHIARRMDALEKTIVQGKFDGKRRQGRSPQRER